MGRVVFLHPDLGLGGAERLIVDAAQALSRRGHQVTIYTGYYDKNRCFEETIHGSFHVKTIGSFIPRSIFGKFHALLAYLKMIIIALYVNLFSRHDLVICDQVSACIPFIKLDLIKRPKVIFYCHFPDQLLTTRENRLKSIYRRPLDTFEEFSTRLSDVILVNSKFTSNIVKRTFKSLRDRDLTVLYPCVNVDRLRAGLAAALEKPQESLEVFSRYEFIFLTLNRFERKKKLELAIEAFSEFTEAIKDDEKGQSMKAHLIVTGGYDKRLLDSVRYYDDLVCLVDKLKLGSSVTFIKSPNDAERNRLLHLCDVVLYTPENEHFGIVPLEAMAFCKPVVACASGGPLETVEHNKTGYLCQPNKYSFSGAMIKLYNDKKLGFKLGEAGLKRVYMLFHSKAFGDRLDEICYPSQ